jgi:hypothetical protein
MDIAEPKFKRKGKKGLISKKYAWVVGLVERNWGISYYFYVENRNSTTLSSIIETYVSTNAALVCTVEWRGYNKLKGLGYNLHTEKPFAIFRPPEPV